MDIIGVGCAVRRTMVPDNSRVRAVGTKIAIDQLIYAPIFTCVLYTYLQLAHRESADSILPVLQARPFIASLLASATCHLMNV
jgi:hypothetical protein